MSTTDKSEGFAFQDIKRVAVTPVKNQANTSTCWSFATLSFFESELLRLGKQPPNFSEMYVVRMTYPRKAEHYVRMHGRSVFSAGSLAGDVLKVVKEFGLMSNGAYTGLFAGQSKHDHSEMDALLKAALDSIVSSKKKKLSSAWRNALAGILDAYLGAPPSEFVHENKTYTPRSFADSLGLNVDDYVELTSYLHHPFYSSFAVEVPDNWSNNSYYNLPIDEFTTVTKSAIEAGYSVVWDGDITETSFRHKKGVALMPVKQWENRTSAEKSSIGDQPEEEVKTTQEFRQECFDNYASTDDHLMHIIGLAKDKNGTLYFIAKNSWGEMDNKFDGLLYLSEQYFRAKTVSVMINRNALPKALAAKI